MRSLVLLLSVALGFPSTVLAGEPVSVDIEASNMDRDGPTLEKQLRARVAAALTEAGMTVDPQATERRVRIRVHRNEVMGYEVEIGTEVEGVAIDSGVEPFVCDPCRVLDLYDRVEGTIPEAVAAIREHEAPAPTPLETPTAATPTEPASEPEPRETASPVTDDEPRKARVVGALGWTGIAVGAASIGTMMFGATQINRPPTQKRSPMLDEFVIKEDTTRQGWILFGVGIAGLAASATMVAVDLTVLRRQRQRRVSAGPDVGRGITGFVLHGRF